MNRVMLKLECKFGHELHATPWVDADGNVRFIVSDCLICAGLTESNERDELINLIE